MNIGMLLGLMGFMVLVGGALARELGRHGWRVRLVFEPRDLWVGAYRDTVNRRLYICLLPCLPLVIEWPHA